MLSLLSSGGDPNISLSWATVMDCEDITRLDIAAFLYASDVDGGRCFGRSRLRRCILRYARSHSAMSAALVAGQRRSSDSASLSSSSVRSPVLNLATSSAIRDRLKNFASSRSSLARRLRTLMFILQVTDTLVQRGNFDCL